MTNPEELKAFFSIKENGCTECGAEISPGGLITLKRPAGALCLSCSDLDHLVYLPSGNAALTRRAWKYSSLSVVVLQFSTSRNRNERKGVLVSAEGLARAENECLSDEEQRAKRRERDQVKAKKRDEKYIQEFAAAIRKLFPGCPEETASGIAAPACEKYSGRVGRAAGAKALDDAFVTLAVRAHIRHAETNYDELLSKCFDRDYAREQIRGAVDDCISRWRKGG